MSTTRPQINVVEKNDYAPQPFVFTESAICLRDAIRAAGYPSEHLVNRVDPGAYSILLGCNPSNVRGFGDVDRNRCAIFNLEQLGSDSPLAGPEYRKWLADWLVLDYHDSNIRFLNRENGADQLALELPLVPSTGLVIPGEMTKTVDVLFYGTMSERRAQVLRDIEALGLTVEVVAGAYGADLSPAVRRARLVLHVHYYERALFPVARVVQPVMLGVPIVCEKSVFSELNDWSHSGIVFAGYEHLAQTCRELIDDPARIARRVRLSLEYVQHIDFAGPFEQAVRTLESLPTRVRQPAPEPPLEEGMLSNEEIEAILEAEAANLPEAHEAAPKLAVVQREPGQGPMGKWIAWLLITFMLLGGLRYWFAW